MGGLHLEQYPPEIRNGTFWFLKHIYYKIFGQNKHFFLVVCGESGSGKSYAAMSIAKAIYPKFNPNESVVFTAREFSQLTKVEHPKGFPIILDDSGIAAGSGDALTKEVKTISKIAQSIRHKNYQVILTLPNFELLAKSVRLNTHYYGEPVVIDFDKKICHMKFQRLKTASFKGWITRKNMTKTEKIYNENTGYMDTVKTKIQTVPVPKIDDETTRVYENLKSARMKDFNTVEADDLEYRDDKRRHKTKKAGIVEYATKVKNEREKYMDEKGKIGYLQIIKDFNVSKAMAKDIAQMAMI